MSMGNFAGELEAEISKEYTSRGDRLGWRLLYSPASVLDGAKVAFIGLNPGGTRDEPDHPSFARPPGSSAYVAESWKKFPPGTESLQRQVRLLFDRIRVAPENVLAGNLVPFRSPDWSSLPERRDALLFGKTLWRKILERARPDLVVAMGADVSDHVAELLHVGQRSSVPVGWASVTATKGQGRSATFVGLPHLSRYRIMGRAQSREAVDWLFPV